MAEFKDRSSKFVAYAFPVVDEIECKHSLNMIRKEHPKATHHCFACRFGLDGNNYRVSDDGEPSGTAGRPILGQIDSRELTDLLIVVVRYFGGTLLGTPGLINAYKTAASLALQVTPLVRKPVLVDIKLQFDYTRMNDVMRIVKQYDCIILHQETQLFCSMKIGIAKKNSEEVLAKLKDMEGVELEE